ncbi:leptomycin b resistance protein pmd1 [Colletotrichum tabaci]|uniref:Leptomycin b resistance protein pmd1 n=1 Tax=Colletotrichum tabaci TaxID=1209068 RepID=A0AAV9TM46_9PEZI
MPRNYFPGLVGTSDVGKSNIMKWPSGAIVPQGAALFDVSVRFNASLGASLGHDVIVSIPDGYDTERHCRTCACRAVAVPPPPPYASGLERQRARCRQ